MQKPTTNDIRYSIDIRNEDFNCLIKIRLNDECRNRHEDFSITATFWSPGRARVDGNMLCGGCCHDIILEVRPDLKMFIDLHLADVDGMPMHTAANGYYHLKGGDVSMERYFGLPAETVAPLYVALSQTHFCYLMEKAGIPELLKQKAQIAINWLNEHSEYTFEPKGEKRHYKPLTERTKARFDKLYASGFFENFEDRLNGREAKVLERRNKTKVKKLIRDERSALEKKRRELLDAETVCEINALLIETFKKEPNAIFYNHTRQFSFNWKSWGDKYTELEIETAKEAINEKFPGFVSSFKVADK